MNFYTLTFKSKFFVFFSILIILIILSIYIVCIEIFVRKYIVTSKLDNQSVRLIETGKNFKISLLGTSHTDYGDKLMKINNLFFHYGQAYTYPHVMYAKTKMLLEYAPNLKYIIIEADMHQFYDFSMNNKSSASRFGEILKRSESSSDKFILSSFDPEIKPILHDRLLKEIFNVKKINVPKKTNDTQVIVPWHQKIEDEKISLSKARHKSFGYDNTNMNQKSLEYFEKTIQLFLSNNIKIILIQHPIDKLYYELMDDTIKKQVDGYISQISKKYNLKILDYKNIYFENSEYFYNQDHLNSLGIDKFSKLLNDDLNEILFK